MESIEDSYRSYLDGDKASFDNIIKSLRNSLTLFINRYVHNVTVAEDICIDVFMELIVHKHRYNFKTSLKTYLFMIGRSKALDYIKHNKKLEITDIDDCDIADEKQLEDLVIQNEKYQKLNTAVLRLPDEMKYAVHLVYFEGMTYKEVAKVMKKSEKQIDNLLYRAKIKLKAYLGKDGDLFYEND